MIRIVYDGFNATFIGGGYLRNGSANIRTRRFP